MKRLQGLALDVDKACEQLEFMAKHPHGRGSVETLKERFGSIARDLRAALEIEETTEQEEQG